MQKGTDPGHGVLGGQANERDTGSRKNVSQSFIYGAEAGLQSVGARRQEYLPGLSAGLAAGW
jgi:hypothetical protein